MTKETKSAVEIARIIRKRLGVSELRIAVFSHGRGWRANVYADPSPKRRELQKKVDEVSDELQMHYELET